MKRTELLEKFQKTGVVAVLRADTANKAVKAADACVEGGVKGIELTFTVPHADQAISELTQKYANSDVVIGAGTVLDPVSARLAMIAGANFIVSPTFDAEIAKICNLYQVPYIPGIYTPNEAQEALRYGSEIVKLFPGATASPLAIKEYTGPFPYLNVMPSGGVSVSNLHEWFEAGAVVVGVGGALVGPVATEDYDAITQNAKEFMAEYKKISQ